MGRKKVSEAEVEAIRDSIAVTAEQLFRDVGYTKTTVGDIANRLGMSQPNVYRYFATKAAINACICERVVGRIEQRCQAARAASPDAKQALEAFLLEYFRAVKDNVIKDKRLHEMVVNAVDQCWPVIQAHIDRMYEELEALLQDGVAAGILGDIDVAAVAQAMQNAFSAFTYPQLVERQLADAATSGGCERIEQDLRTLLNVMLHGIMS